MIPRMISGFHNMSCVCCLHIISEHDLTDSCFGLFFRVGEVTAIVKPDWNVLKADLRDLQLNHHSIGLFQVLDSSTDTASSDEDEMTENSTPEEIVVSKLQVNIVHFAGLPGIILCMGPANDRWHYSVMPSLIGWPMHRMIPGLQLSSIFLNWRLEIPMLWFKYILWAWNCTNSVKMQKSLVIKKRKHLVTEASRVEASNFGHVGNFRQTCRPDV